MRYLGVLALAAVAGCASPRVLAPGTSLYVNQCEEHYVVHKSQREGERDLVRIVASAPVEDLWIFDRGNGLWREAGLNETPTSANVYMPFFENTDNLIYYHLHLPQPEHQGISAQAFRLWQEAFPCPEDLVVSHEWQRRCAIASRYGIMEFGPAELAYREFRLGCIFALEDQLRRGDEHETAIRTVVPLLNQEYGADLVYRPASELE